MWVLLDLLFGSLEHTLLVLKEFYFLLICRTLFYLDFHQFLWPSHLNPFSIVLHSSPISLILPSITWLIPFLFSHYLFCVTWSIIITLSCLIGLCLHNQYSQLKWLLSFLNPPIYWRYTPGYCSDNTNSASLNIMTMFHSNYLCNNLVFSPFQITSSDLWLLDC